MEQKERFLARGAEAVIIKKGRTVIKDRIEKSYRHPQLDEKLRSQRTRAEAKLLEKAHSIINVPKIMNGNEILPNKPYEITIEYIPGGKLADNLEKLNYQQICKEIGKSLAKLHDAGIIHGDLTTSNMIYVPSSSKNQSLASSQPNHQKDFTNNNNNNIPNKEHERASAAHETNKTGKVYFIDFGLGFHSSKIEDKAVDLHLIKEALEAKHPSIYEKAFQAVLKGYNSSANCNKVLKQLEAVEKRGRYKAQY